MRFLLTMGLAGALATLPTIALAQKDDGVAEAIRFEKAKQAAADRQARIEAARVRNDHSADRMATETKVKPRTKTAAAKKTAPPTPQQK